jgi:glycosyltransferase involved in cell wall biosynthesis
MIEHNPKVSVGLVVFNGENYLREAIHSILAQTFTDFELIISDNASTDGTEKICQEYATKDSRIRYSRNIKNIGGVNNENRTFELSRGQYFHWAAYDDLFAPEFLSKCVEVLDRDPSVILCYPLIVSIDECGNKTKTTAFNRGTSDRPSDRFRSLFTIYHGNEACYGLIRADILRENGLQQQNYNDCDRTFICELSLYGKFYEIPEPLFYKRYHSKNVYLGGLSWYARATWFEPETGGKIVYPQRWIQLFHFFAIITKAPLSMGEKSRCYLNMFAWFYSYKRTLLEDLLLFFYLLFQTYDKRKQIYEKNVNWL